ncbi:MAG: response regulator [Robiginitomaculum sp.]|nr:response regulator [Robiginitomaculum sp.]
MEDNQEFAEELAEILRRHQLDVKISGSAENSLPILLDWRPVFLICDLHLPGLSGDRLVNMITSLDHKLLVILMSADHRALEETAKVLDAMYLLSTFPKPLDIKGLISVIGVSKAPESPY